MKTDEILKEIATAAPGEIPVIVGELERLKAVAYARLTAPQPAKPAESDMIDDKRAAEIAGTSRRWLNAKTAGLRFRHDLSRERKRYDEAGLRTWLASRRG